MINKIIKSNNIIKFLFSVVCFSSMCTLRTDRLYAGSRYIYVCCDVRLKIEPAEYDNEPILLVTNEDPAIKNDVAQVVLVPNVEVQKIYLNGSVVSLSDMPTAPLPNPSLKLIFPNDVLDTTPAYPVGSQSFYLPTSSKLMISYKCGMLSIDDISAESRADMIANMRRAMSIRNENIEWWVNRGLPEQVLLLPKKS